MVLRWLLSDSSFTVTNDLPLAADTGDYSYLVVLNLIAALSPCDCVILIDRLSPCVGFYASVLN